MGGQRAKRPLRPRLVAPEETEARCASSLASDVSGKPLTCKPPLGGEDKPLPSKWPPKETQLRSAVPISCLLKTFSH